MNNVWIALGIVLGVPILIPLIVYFSVKLGTLGFLSGRQMFYQPHERQDDGEDQTK